jgi:hypothetical protein
MTAVNPFYDTSEAIWAMLVAKSDFVAMFPADTVHQVRYTTALVYAPNPEIDTPAPNDYPICRVRLVKAKPATEQDSTNSYLDATYAIEICTGQQYQSVAMAATWAVYRAMLNWRTYVRDVVTWNGTACVYDVNADDGGYTDDNKERNRGTDQWIAVWAITVRLNFSTTELQAH